MSDLQREKIWDPVSRLWHWVFACAVTLAWIFGEFMDFDTIQWHFYCGYVILGLLAFRLLWGFVGPRPVRHSTMLRALLEIPTYLRGIAKRAPSGVAGHNPLGTLAVFAMLAAVLLQAGAGLFIEAEDFFESAPLAHWVSSDITRVLAWIHGTLPDVILALVALHLGALAFYFVWKRENLVLPMITGWKWVRRPFDS